MTRSAVDDIPGLGPARKKRLIKELGGVNAIKRATLEELKALAWLPDQVATAIYEQLHAPPAKGAAGASRVAAALAHLRMNDD
jgi:excinuclease ABC subunit C